ncbi:MAG: hypothetical protein CMO55_01575 [Verrucomicrobiales bacterium]|nr:hypothetical protein [Verrucomicrobiales bacterium]
MCSDAEAGFDPSGSQVEQVVPWEVGRICADPTLDVFYVVDLTDDRIVAFDGQTGEVEAVVDLGDDADGGFLAFSLDGETVYYSTPVTSRIHSFSAGTLVPTGVLEVKYPVWSFVCGCDGNLFGLATVDKEIKLRIFDSRTGEVASTPKVQEIDDSSYNSNAIVKRNPSGTLLFISHSASLNVVPVSRYAIKTWNSLHSVLFHKFAHDESSNLTLSTDNDTVSIFDRNSGELKSGHLGEGHTGLDVVTLDGAPDFYVLSKGDSRHYIRRFSKSDGATLGEWPLDTNEDVPDGGYLAAGRFDVLVSGSVVYRFVNEDGDRVLGLIRPDEEPEDSLPTVGGIRATIGTYSDRIDVTWQPVPGASEYWIFRRAIGPPPNALVPVGTTVNTLFTDPDITFLGEFRYHVVAVDGSRSSNLAGDAPGLISDRPPIIRYLDTSALVDGIQVNWEEGDSRAHTVRILRSETERLEDAVEMAVIDELFWPSTHPYWSQFSWIDEDVEVGRAYYYWITSENENGVGGPYPARNPGMTFSIAARSPSDLSATDGAFDDRVELSWAVSKTATSYRVLRNTTDSVVYAETLAAGLQETRFSDTTALPGISYYYWVRGENDFGGGETRAERGHIRSNLPVEPNHVWGTFRTFHEKIVIQWEEIPNATSYDLYRSESRIENMLALVRSNISGARADDVPPETEKTYYYAVVAKNEFGESRFSTLGKGMRSDPGPPAPTEIEATQSEDNMFEVDLTWKGVDGVASYSVYWNTEDDFLGASDSGTAVGEAYTVRVRYIEKEYFFWIRSSGSGRSGDPSESVSVFVEERFLPPPTGVKASQGTSPDRVEITWEEVAGADYYSVYRSEINDASTAEQIVEVASFLKAFDYGAEHGVTYYYFVEARTNSQKGELSEGAAGSLAPLVPTTPVLISATDGDFKDRIEVGWTSSSHADWYNLYRSPGEEEPYSLIETTTTTAFVDYDVLPGILYSYYVVAANSEANSEASVINSGHVWIDPPTGFRASEGMFQGAVELNWEPVPGADSYIVYRSPLDDFSVAEIVWATADLTYFDEEGEPGYQYYYFIQAVAGEISGVLSSSVVGFGTVGPPFRPDALLGASYEALRGDNIYSFSRAQRLKRIVKGKRRTAFYLVIENDGESGDVFRIIGTPGNRFFRPVYRVNTFNDTGVITTRGLQRGYASSDRTRAGILIRPTARAAKSKRRLSKVFRLRVGSIGDPSLSDTVHSVVEKR